MRRGWQEELDRDLQLFIDRKAFEQLPFWEQVQEVAGSMLGYVAHLAAQALPEILVFGVGVLIWRAVVRRPLELQEKVIAGAVATIPSVTGAFLGSNLHVLGNYDHPGALANALAALSVAGAVGALLYLTVASALRLKSKVLGTGVRWMANAALVLPIASTHRVAQVSWDEFIIGAAVLVVAGMVVTFVLGCLFHLVREALAASSSGGREQYQTAFEEFSRGQLDTGLWAQCLAKADGDEIVAKARYLKVRAAELARLGSGAADNKSGS